jgi:hypothetical protein
MGIAYHTLYSADGTILNIADRAYLGTITVVYGSSSGTAAITPVVVTWTEPIPMPYTVIASPIENATYWFTSKTTIGFTLNAVGTASLVGGSMEVLIIS